MIMKLLPVMFLIVPLVFASCASHTAVYPEPVNIQSNIQPGDTVKIVTKDNEETEFVVVEVTDEAIVGESQTVAFTNITILEKQTASAGKNFLVISLATIGVAALVVLAVASGAGGNSYCCFY